MRVHVSIGLAPTPPPHNGCLSHGQRGQLSPWEAQTASAELWLSQDGQLGNARPQAGVTLGTSGSLFLCGISLVSTEQPAEGYERPSVGAWRHADQLKLP